MESITFHINEINLATASLQIEDSIDTTQMIWVEKATRDGETSAAAASDTTYTSNLYTSSNHIAGPGPLPSTDSPAKLATAAIPLYSDLISRHLTPNQVPFSSVNQNHFIFDEYFIHQLSLQMMNLRSL